MRGVFVKIAREFGNRRARDWIIPCWDSRWYEILTTIMDFLSAERLRAMERADTDGRYEE